MSALCTFLQSVYSFINRKAVLKKCYRTCAVFTAGAAVLAIICLTDKNFGGGGKNRVVVAQADESQEEQEVEEPEQEEAQVSVAPAVVSVEAHPSETVTQENVTNVINVTEKEYEILLRIVEAEATDEDVKGKMLVANVVLNRVNSDRFPNDIESVVFQKKGSKYQFSPLKDGRYYKVEITETTRLAVDRVLAGEDESMGALFFVCREYANPKNLRWFDENLTNLFKYGCHEFFAYPN